ncbi:MAG: glycosyltransferase family 2 protein [Clostridium sp.]|nr:glycosyltransferase family 2 protein [Clostridium sp.]
MKTIDIIVPCYNEEECVKLLYAEVEKECSSLETENIVWRMIYIDDGSKDNTLGRIKELVQEKGADSVKYISFSRNFGKEAAIYAGLSYAKGDYVVLMDADLQHPPALIPQMLVKIEEGYDCCGARRVSRKGEPKVRSLFSRLFYRSMKRLTGLEMTQGGSDYRMMTRQVAETIVSMKEKERFVKGIFSWVGFSTCWIEYQNVERAAGKTKWSFGGLFRYAVNGLIAFAATPLRAAIWMGFIIDIITIIYAIYFFVSNINSTGQRTGYATIVLLLMFFGGTIILLLGVIGEYLARIYMESKDRPIFILKDSNIKR